MGRVMWVSLGGASASTKPMMEVKIARARAADDGIQSLLSQIAQIKSVTRLLHNGRYRRKRP